MVWNRSNRQPAHAEPQLDVEQARLLAILREADGPVSFAALRARGIENPATLCYELELAGIPLEREQRLLANGTTVTVGVALAPGAAVAPAEAPEQAQLPTQPAPAAQPSSPAPDPPTQRLAARRPRRTAAGATSIGASAIGFGELRRAWADRIAAAVRRLFAQRTASPAAPARLRGALVVGAALVALAVILALISVPSASNRPASRSARVAPAAAPPRGAAAPAQRTTPSQPRATASRSQTSTTHTTSSTSATASEPPSAAELEEEGHRLLEAGNYAAAIVKLREALGATGGSPQRCAHPETESCLTYAYALYDLGRALQLSHQPAAAIPVLNSRMEIENQRQTVASALARARAELHPAQPKRPAHHRQKPPPQSQPRANGRPRPTPPRPTGEGEVEAEPTQSG